MGGLIGHSIGWGWPHREVEKGANWSTTANDLRPNMHAARSNACVQHTCSIHACPCNTNATCMRYACSTHAAYMQHTCNMHAHEGSMWHTKACHGTSGDTNTKQKGFDHPCHLTMLRSRHASCMREAYTKPHEMHACGPRHDRAWGIKSWVAPCPSATPTNLYQPLRPNIYKYL